jgi:hypothetical protein
MSDHLRALDQESLHFFTALEKLLENKHLMKDGELAFGPSSHQQAADSKL